MTILELLIQNGHAPGAYFNVCRECKAKFIGDKRAITCLECASKRVGNVAEPNAHSVLSDVLTDEEIEDLQVRLYNHALLVICSELTAEERTRSRNNIIREWFGEMCSRYVR